MMEKPLNILAIDNDPNNINYRKSGININYNYLKINDINELLEIFEKTSDIHLCDTSEFLTLILDNGQEIPLHQYTNQHAIFLKITDEKLESRINDDTNDILIYLNDDHKIAYYQYWQQNSTHEFLHGISSKIYAETVDLCGYYNTMMIIEEAKYNKLEDCIIAPKYCTDYIINIANKKYQGFLPASGQLYFLSCYQKLINYILTEINSKPINFENNYFWSSTESSFGTVWSLDRNQIGLTSKSSCSNSILPLFKEIPNYTV